MSIAYINLLTELLVGSFTGAEGRLAPFEVSVEVYHRLSAPAIFAEEHFAEAAEIVKLGRHFVESGWHFDGVLV